MSNSTNKWADYCISAVRYDAERNHIVKLRMRPDLGEELGDLVDKTREVVASEIEEGLTFVTIIKNSEGKWNKGQPVEIVEIKGVKYLKTERNDSEGDNLENLPEFE